MTQGDSLEARALRRRPVRERIVPRVLVAMLAGTLVSSASAQTGWNSARVTIRSHQGTPCFFIDGRPEPPVFIYQTKLTDHEPAQFRAQGYRLFSFVGNMSSFGMSMGWIGPDQYDYAECDSALREFVERVPDGFCIPRVWVSAPQWWVEKHPEEAVRFATGVGFQDNQWGGTIHESFASLRWRREGGEAFRRFLRHIAESPYAKHVAGIHVAGGIYGEWHGWNAPDLPDTSEPMRSAFSTYVARKYQHDPARVAQAWREPVDRIEAVSIPSKQQQDTLDDGIFRNPSLRRHVIDYYEALHEATVDDVEHFCNIVKAESAGRLLTQVFYGYLPDLPWPNAGDHRAAPRLLRSPLVDIVVSPHSYGRRRPGQDGLFRNFPASSILHGKLFLDEGDDCTSTAPSNWPGRYAKTVEESIELMRREFGNTVTHGVGMYYMDMSGTFFNDPRLMSELGHIKRAADLSMKYPRTSVAQVAVISCLRSEFYTAARNSGRNQILQPLYDLQIGELCRSGAAFDLYHIDDLTEGRIPSCRAYVFLDAFYLSDQDRQAIDRLKKDDRLLLWFYAPGFVISDSLSLRAMTQVTGLPFEMRAAGDLRITLDPDVAGGQAAESGLSTSQAGLFTPLAPDQRVLGWTVDSRKPALVSKEMGGWRSVYCLTPPVSASILRGLFGDAGVHIYSETGDNLSANASWIALHAAATGPKTIRLPRPSAVYDACTDRLLSSSATIIEQQMKRGRTGIWLLADPQLSSRPATDSGQ